MYTLLETYLAEETPPTRPDRDFRKSPEKCGDEDSVLQPGSIQYRVGQFSWGIRYLYRRSIRRGESRTPHGQPEHGFYCP